MPEPGIELSSANATVTIATKIATARYSRLRKACAPRCMAAAICCMRAEPSSCASTKLRW